MTPIDTKQTPVSDDEATDPESPIRYGLAARSALLRGADQLAGLIAPTLGPVARTVAIAPILGQEPPEILDTAATIARRTIELADPFENAGAMMLRDLVLRVADEVGDGGATTAVLTRALLHDGARLLAGGVEPVGLCAGLRDGLRTVLDALEMSAWKLDHPDEIARVARHTLDDPALAEIVGEILDTVGPDGIVMVENAHGAETLHQYVDGVRWEGGYSSAHLLPPGETTGRLVEPRILLCDFNVERPEQLLPALEACVAADVPRLVIIAPDVHHAVVAMLLANRERGTLAGALAIQAPSIGAQRIGILDDLAAATGGRCLHRELGDRLERVTLADLGQARQVWATRQAFGVIGGRGDRAAIRKRVTDVRGELTAHRDDPYLRSKLRERIAKLTGTGASIQVGGPTKRAQELLKQRVEAAVTSCRAALESGVVAGGGGALLTAARALDGQPGRDDYAAGLRLLARALAAPAEVIARNAGLDGRAIVAGGGQRPERAAYDVLSGAWVDARAAGLVDPLGVTRTALEAAVSTAATALTAEVVIRRKDPLRRIRREWRGRL
ncbi:MAG: chaperonin GroEL [Chloroflexi bacterium]|nr:chaperonin GroEL [Chloroflexota bacterium]